MTALLPATDLFHDLPDPETFLGLLDRSDEDVLVALGGKPLLLRLPGTAAHPKARLVSCLLHGNEDSGYRAVLDHLRTGIRHPFDLWVLIGNVRAATQEGWFAHRYLDDQEDFNRVWGLQPPTTRMRRCARAVLEELASADLEAAVDLHNNTGRNPYYAVLPANTPEVLSLAATCAELGLFWGTHSHTLMQSLGDRCPAVAIECGLPGLPASAEFAAGALGRFLAAEHFCDGRSPSALFEVLYRVNVRSEVGFTFGGELTGDLDLVLTPGLDGANFGMLLAGTEIGRVPLGTAVPLEAISRGGEDEADRWFRVEDGSLIVTQDLTPLMMTTTALQARRDCLFYIGRRRA